MSNSPLNDDDTLLAFKAKGEGRQRVFPVSWKALKIAISALVPAVQGPKGDPGSAGKDGINGKDGAKGDTGPAGAPKRVERYTAVTNASGVASFTFSPNFAATPDIDIIETWSGEQLVGGGVLTSSATGCTVQAMVSRGTLLLTAGPFTKAGAGVSVTVRAIGN